MKRLVVIALATVGSLLSFSLGFGAGKQTGESNTPVFRIFAPAPDKGGNSNQVSIAGKQPLMIVTALSEARLSNDRNAVRITLTPSDTKAFAAITRKYNQGFLVLEANGRVLEAMQVASPVTNGVLEFRRPDDDVVIEYLRKRFRLGESR